MTTWLNRGDDEDSVIYIVKDHTYDIDLPYKKPKSFVLLIIHLNNQIELL